MNSQEILELAVKAVDSKRAEDTIVLDVHEVSLLADYFLITSGTNERQINAIVDAVEETIEKQGSRVKRIEGRENGKWILMDLGDVIVHVFKPEERSFYNLEKLWNDAPLVKINDWLKEN